jgi:hypothetical protein
MKFFAPKLIIISLFLVAVVNPTKAQPENLTYSNTIFDGAPSSVPEGRVWRVFASTFSIQAHGTQITFTGSIANAGVFVDSGTPITIASQYPYVIEIYLKTVMVSKVDLDAALAAANRKADEAADTAAKASVAIPLTELHSLLVDEVQRIVAEPYQKEVAELKAQIAKLQDQISASGHPVTTP